MRLDGGGGTWCLAVLSCNTRVGVLNCVFWKVELGVLVISCHVHYVGKYCLSKSNICSVESIPCQQISVA